MSDALDRRGLITSILPVGPARSDDADLITTGTVYAVDAATATVQVGVRNGTVILPAVAARYRPGGLARVLIDPIQTRPVQVLGAVDPIDPVIIAGVFSTGTGTITISYQGLSSTIPTASGTYTVGQSAWVMLDDWGVPVVAVGPSTQPAPGWVDPIPPGGAGTITATASIGPQSSGTYRSMFSRWDSWNTDRYGGASDIYQGNAYGSGLLVGLASYGDQIVNLGAVTISSISVSVRKTDDGLTAALTVQGTPDGTRPGGPPSPTGDTASSGAIGSGGWGSIDLTANMREAFRTGAAKALTAIGAQYAGFGGTGTPSSFVLNITYTKNA